MGSMDIPVFDNERQWCQKSFLLLVIVISFCSLCCNWELTSSTAQRMCFIAPELTQHIGNLLSNVENVTKKKKCREQFLLFSEAHRRSL